MKILIYGLSGSGKSTLAIEIANKLNLPLVNGDVIRDLYSDWDFSITGREQQAERILSIYDDNYIADFICPFEKYQSKFDVKILMNTMTSSKFPDTDSIFEYGVPDIVINSWNYKIDYIIQNIMNLP